MQRTIIARGVGLGAAACLLVPLPARAQPVHPAAPQRADFALETASQDTRHIADWILHSSDNGGLPFMIVDKAQAKVFVFGPAGAMLGAAPALLGSAVGDHTVPGIGSRPLSRIRPDERTTPAGRFVASLDRNLRGEEILWVDYEAAVSLHRVVAGTPKERRAERLSSPTPLDNRISYGCINVPAKFFDDVVSPAFTGTSAVVYVLPETRPSRQVFPSYDVEERALADAAAQ